MPHPKIYSLNNLPKKIPLGRAENLTGKKFEHLTALFRVENPTGKGHETYWACECDCKDTNKNIVVVQASHLKNGTTQSCGCLQLKQASELGKKYGTIVGTKYGAENGRKTKHDLTGQRFGKLVVIKDTGKRTKSNSVIWLCLCDCGNYHEASNNDLIQGHVSSCSNCVIKSKGEEQIKYLLNINNISFIKEYKNKELNNTLKRQLRFDFFINNQYIIEYDGEQHFHYRKQGWNNKEYHQKIRETDSIKNKYCFENNIPLIRIPYNANFDINDLRLETTRFLLTPENEEEYYESRK